MANQDKFTSAPAPQITIQADADNYRINLGVLTEFIEQTNKFMSYDNIVCEISTIESFVLGDDEMKDLSAEALRRPLKLLREMRLLFDQITYKLE